MDDRFGLDSRIVSPYSFGMSGMGFVPRLTPQEIEAASARKIEQMRKKLFDAPKNDGGLEGLWNTVSGDYQDELDKFRKRRDGYLNSAKKAIGSDAPKSVIDEYAFSLYSIDLAKPDFDRYLSFTSRYLAQVKSLTASGIMDSAALLIRERVESYPLEIPFFGQLSIYDIKLDNFSSMNNLIDTVKTTNWTDISRSAISTFAPKGGFADYGVKAIDTAVSVANQVATLSSTIGAVGFSAGISAAVGAVIPWVLAAIALIAIGESLYNWLSGAADEEKQEAQYEKAWKEADSLHAHIQELLLLNLTDTNYTKMTLNMRLNELSAYGSTVKNDLWTDCTAITRSNLTPAAYCGNPNALRSDGTTRAFVPVSHKSSKGLTKKKIMMCKVEYLKSVIQYLSSYEEIGDRRLAFEYLGMTTLPNANKFALGLWDSDSYRRNPLVKFKPPVLSRAAQAELQKAQADRIARGIEIKKRLEQQIAEKQKSLPKLTSYAQYSKTDSKKSSSAPLLLGAAAASAVYLYYNR